jgi:hypothetical protein
MEVIVKKFFIALLLLIVCPLSGTCIADEKSDCLTGCANDKRANDMYCPPAGGITDEEHNQCVDRNTFQYNYCVNRCSPPATPPADQQPAATPSSPAAPNEPAATDKQN